MNGERGRRMGGLYRLVTVRGQLNHLDRYQPWGCRLLSRLRIKGGVRRYRRRSDHLQRDRLTSIVIGIRDFKARRNCALVVFRWCSGGIVEDRQGSISKSNLFKPVSASKMPDFIRYTSELAPYSPTTLSLHLC